MFRMMKLIIGNKRYSSWSLRPWLLMKQFEIEFEEILIPLDQPQTAKEILKYSPSGKVPALIDDRLIIWESLAIAEYLNEKYPEKQLWPADVKDRARARALSNEMHAGFQTLRTHMPHDLQKTLTAFDWQPAKNDIDRICAIWRDCLKNSGGPFLFRTFSIADAMFAPVANRFVSYGVSVDAQCSRYISTLRELKSHQLWIQEALVESHRMPKYEV